jgi:hypothetical protein
VEISHMSNASTPARRLRRKDASAYLLQVHGVSRTPQTLAKLACIGGGPQFVKFGHTPLYAPADLDSWVQTRLSRPIHSTSELAA